jgi:alpha-ketoglutarate-dependent taurine dioxygenase
MDNVVARDLKRFKRKALSVSQELLIKTEYLDHGGRTPLVIRPALDGVELVAWAAGNRELIEDRLLDHGALLLRGFAVRSPEEFEQFIKTVSNHLLQYNERSSPRKNVSGNIYTSTDYPADQSIFFHNENSYQSGWPLRIFFFCVTVAEQGGETPIADCRRVLGRISPSIVARFVEKQVMYVRNFGDGFGLPWQTVFQTTDKAAVEQYCLKSGIDCEWKSDDRLRTRQVRPAVARHPRTGERSWFNHAAFFHVSTLDPSIREALLEEFEEDELPSNTYYGDGSRIEPSVLDEIRDAYTQEAVSFPWERHDVLVLDNIYTAHSRSPYKGDRKVLVGMADPLNWKDVLA